VARGAGAVLLARDYHQRDAVGLVLHRGVVDRHLLAFATAAAEVLRVAALDPVEHPVADADVGEGTADHHVVVAAPAAVAVEVRRLHAALLQVPAGGGVLLDRAGRAELVGGVRVPEQRQHAGTHDVVDRAHLHRHAVEVGRVLDVGRGLVPGEGLAGGRIDAVPAGVALEHVGIVLREQLGADGGGDGVADLLVGRPDVTQVDVVAVAVLAQRLAGQVDVHGAGDRVGHYQRRGGQVVHLDLGVD